MQKTMASVFLGLSLLEVKNFIFQEHPKITRSSPVLFNHKIFEQYEIEQWLMINSIIIMETTISPTNCIPFQQVRVARPLLICEWAVAPDYADSEMWFDKNLLWL